MWVFEIVVGLFICGAILRHTRVEARVLLQQFVCGKALAPVVETNGIQTTIPAHFTAFRLRLPLAIDRGTIVAQNLARQLFKLLFYPKLVPTEIFVKITSIQTGFSIQIRSHAGHSPDAV